MRGKIRVEVKKCLACKTCEIECALAHSPGVTLDTLVRVRERVYPRLQVEERVEEAVPIRCCHCETAPCVMVCPTGALYREARGEPVRVREELCVGCGYCVVVCPYGVPQEKGRVMTKCDLCFSRLEKGELPACVEGCPTKALRFMEIPEE